MKIRSFSSILVTIVSGLVLACGGRTPGGGPVDVPDARPPDARPPAGDGGVPCVVAGDCVVAVPFDCCGGCPRVMSREQLAHEECLYEQGQPPPVDPPPQCLMDCFACYPCFPQPLGVACEAFQCVGQGEGCPDPGGEELSELTPQAIVDNPQAYTGRDFRVIGSVIPGLGACDDDCPNENCCDHAILIDGLVLLRGVPCELDLTWWSNDYCADEFHPGWQEPGLLPGRRYEFTGTVNMAGGSPWDPPTLRVDGIRVLEPEGLGGGYQVTVTEVQSDISDPVCTPPQWEVGDDARIYIGHSEGTVRIVAPYFSCMWTDAFWGTSEHGTDFDTWVPIDCDGCCCDFQLTGEVSGDTITGQYDSFDGQCRYVVRFEGSRLSQ